MADRPGRVRRIVGLGVAATVAAGAALAAAASSDISGPADPSALAAAVRVHPPGPTVGGCPMLPATHPFNTAIGDLPVHPRSASMIAKIQSIGGDVLHADVTSDGYGIPYVVVPADQPRVPITYTLYGHESDPGPFPIPPDAPVEGGPIPNGDRHVIVVQEGTCELFELWLASRNGIGWSAGSGAKWDLTTGAPRPVRWTSADAAGLPILPGLIRYDEVASGAVRHALRVTFSQTQRGFVAPASHFASSNPDPDLPAMGQRLRLRSDYDLTGITGHARVIAEAMKTYGIIVADNGVNWFVQGAPDPRWNDLDLRQLRQIEGTAFEVVDTGPTIT